MTEYNLESSNPITASINEHSRKNLKMNTKYFSESVHQNDLHAVNERNEQQSRQLPAISQDKFQLSFNP